MTVTDVVELKAVPVFRAGSYPQGDFDPDVVQALADAYDPQFHEAPNILVHSDPAGEPPVSHLAFGWVRRLYAKGRTLYADFVNVPRRFAELVLAGRIKKRSVEIYPDLAGRGPYLRAVAWPLIPEVKALADVHVTQVFCDDRDFKRIDFLEKENDMTDQNDRPEPLTREELQLAVRQMKDELAAEQRQAAAELEVRTFCEQMVASGRMTPAERQSEEPLLIEQRRREAAGGFAENDDALSGRRMDYYRRRPRVVNVDDDSAPDPAGADPKTLAVVRTFNENREFFARAGLTCDDLLDAEKCAAGETNPLTDL